MKHLLIFSTIIAFALAQQCQDNSTCKGRAASIPIGGDCSSTPSDCVDEPSGSSECKAGICRCKDNFVPHSSNNKCLPIQNEYFKPCEEVLQCTEGHLGQHSVCMSKVCMCIIDVSVVVGFPQKCLLYANKTGDPCSDVKQCHQNLGSGAVCQSGTNTCECDTSQSVSDGTKCLPIVHTVGGICEIDEQCQKGTPGSITEENVRCSQGSCRCISSATTIPGSQVCLTKVKMGESCNHDVVCQDLGVHAECQVTGTGTDRICGCKTTGVPSKDGTKCLAKINKIGGACEKGEDQQCEDGTPGEYSSCSLNPATNEFQCLCKSVAVAADNVCLKSAEIVGDPCKDTKQCESLGEYGFCTEEGKCACAEGSTGSSNGKRCLVKSALIGDTCVDNSQCPDTSFCSSSGYCACDKDYVASNSRQKCLPIVDVIGESCDEAVQCRGGDIGGYGDCVPKSPPVIPDQKVCNCTSEAVGVISSNKCLKKAQLVGDICEHEDQCITGLGFSWCLNGQCICQPGYAASNDNTSCVKSLNLGDSCSDHGQCSQILYSAKCELTDPSNPAKGTTCQCASGYGLPPPEETPVCYKMATTMHDACADHSSQCDKLTGSKCVAGVEGKKTCECNYDNEVVSSNGQKCLPIVGLKSYCEDKVQCSVSNSDCALLPGELRMKCVCQTDQYVESERYPGTCTKILNEMYSECKESVQCSSGQGSLVECRYNRCECIQRYKYQNGKCLRETTLGGRCENDDECRLSVSNYTFCKLPTPGVCTCVDRLDVVEVGGMCYLHKALGDSCVSDNECNSQISGPVGCDPDQKICVCQYNTAGVDSMGQVCGNNANTSTISLLFLLVVVMFSIFVHNT